MTVSDRRAITPATQEGAASAAATTTDEPKNVRPYFLFQTCLFLCVIRTSSQLIS